MTAGVALSVPAVVPFEFKNRNREKDMAEITASMVKTLREKTDAPMMECKKAQIGRAHV